MYCDVFIHPWWTFMLSSLWGCYECCCSFSWTCLWHTKVHISPWYILGSGISGHRIWLYSVSIVAGQLLTHVCLLRPRGLQHPRLPCPSLFPRVCSNSCPFCWWRHAAISSSVTPFSFCYQSFPVFGCFPMSQLFASCGQSIGASVSASVLPLNLQGWLPLALTGLISLQSKRLSKVFSNTTVQKYQSGQNMVHWTRKWKTTSAFLSWEPHEHIMKRQKDFLL